MEVTTLLLPILEDDLPALQPHFSKFVFAYI